MAFGRLSRFRASQAGSSFVTMRFSALSGAGGGTLPPWRLRFFCPVCPGAVVPAAARELLTKRKHLTTRRLGNK